jgi:hypothetical protein
MGGPATSYERRGAKVPQGMATARELGLPVVRHPRLRSAAAWMAGAPSCVSATPQLKREWSLGAGFGRDDASCHVISNTWRADGFRSSSPTTPATQSSLPQ